MSLILGVAGSNLKNRFSKLKKNEKSLSHHLNILEKKGKPNLKIGILQNNLEQNLKAQNKTLQDFKDISLPIFENYVNTTNKYLSRFTNNIKMKSLYTPSTKFPESIFNLNLVLEISGKPLRFKQPDYSKKEGNVKFALSEGDKNAVALSFFLAMSEILGVNDKVIVFDDPLSSFDHLRKTSTTNILAKLAQESKQFILTTHDIHFAKALKEKLSFTKCLNLKISKDGTTSFLSIHDIDFDTLNGYQKDLLTIKNYKENPIKTEEEKRKVVRCIRPILETIFKVKYHDDISYNEWLGDIIRKIRKSETNSNLYKLKSIISDIIDLNDYSKKFHHSEQDNEIVNDLELNFFIELLEKTIIKI